MADAAASPPAHDYRVRLEDFQGPLDLLLHLVRRAEVDPANIPVAEIADQYLEHIDSATSRPDQPLDVEVGGEFLVMAATLMELKSRTLMPPDQRPSPMRSGKHDDTDPRAALISQLLAYRQIRDAADRLESHRQVWLKRFPAAKAGVGKRAVAVVDDDQPDLEDLDIMDLVESFGRVAAAVNFDRLGEHKIQFDDTPIELHAADILDRLNRLSGTTGGALPSMTFRELFHGAGRGDIVGLFIATLELTRQRKITVEHDEESGMITIQAREPDGDEENAIAEIPSSITDDAEADAEPGVDPASAE
ncbi:MAG: segregation/condensation protein A [Planctomycetota bacterium]